MRFDHSRAISQDLHAPGTDGRETSAIIGGLGTLYTWNIVSPRLGVTARLSEDGRTILRSSYGRFYQGVLTGEMAPVHPGMTPTITAAFNAETNGYTTTVSVVDPRINLRLDPETRAPRTDGYSVGVDRELTRQLSLALAYVHKRGSHFVGWTDTAGQYPAGDPYARRRGRPAGLGAHWSNRGSPIPAHQSRPVLDEIRRARGRVGETAGAWLARVR